MVIKRRFRGIALPFMLYLVSGVAAVFFINEAGNGSRGIETRNSLLSEIARLSTELSKVTAERLALERRNALVGLFHVDAEFLEERSRVVLNRGNRNDVVIMTVDWEAISLSNSFNLHRTYFEFFFISHWIVTIIPYSFCYKNLKAPLAKWLPFGYA